MSQSIRFDPLETKRDAESARTDAIAKLALEKEYKRLLVADEATLLQWVEHNEGRMESLPPLLRTSIEMWLEKRNSA